MQNYNCSYLRSSALCIGDRYDKCFNVKFIKLRTSCVIKDNQRRVFSLVSEKKCHSFSSFFDGSMLSLPQLKVGHSNTVLPLNGFGYRLRSPYYGAYAKRPYSQIPRAIVNENSNGHVKDGIKNGKTSEFELFNKHWKQAKLLAAQKRNNKGGVRVAVSKQELGTNVADAVNSPFKDIGMVKSTEQLVGDGIEDASLGPSVSSSHAGDKNKGSKAKGKQKLRPRNKKSNEQCLGNIAASDAAAQPGGSERVSQAIKSNTTKKNQSLPASKV